MCSSTDVRPRLPGKRNAASAALRRLRGDAGQSSVEAAFALPVLMVLLLLLVQPGIILYDRIVMESAAVEACRLLATTASSDVPLVEAFVRRRLSAVPEQDLFHRHSDGCTWAIELEGSETAPKATVRITNEVKPVPLIDLGAGLLGLANGNGNLEVRVEATMPTQPAWAAAAEGGLDPRGWVGEWDG